MCGRFYVPRKAICAALATAERRRHEDGAGVAWRYDDAYRLTATHYGIDIDSFFETFADHDNTPGMNEYQIRRRYDLDTRGNRTSVIDEDRVGGEIYDYAYTPDADTNQYLEIDGASFTYDDREQLTHDPTRGLYFAYDYKGQLVLEDTNSDFSSPERRYSYDNQGRRRTEARFYEASYHLHDTTAFTYCPTCLSGGCANAGLQTLDWVTTQFHPWAPSIAPAPTRY